MMPVAFSDRRWNSRIRWIGGAVVVLGLCGCGDVSSVPASALTTASPMNPDSTRGRTGRGDRVSGVPGPVHLHPSDPAAPLTDGEIRAFLQIVGQLPEGRPPAFAPVELPRLQPEGDLTTQIVRYRRAIRQALQPRRQTQHWQSQPDLAAAFSRLQVDPEAFAMLTLRLSVAWSAATIVPTTDVLEVRDRLDRQIAGLNAQLSRPQLLTSTLEQQFQTLEELVALSEFMQLLGSSSQQSMQIVNAHQAELHQVLPTGGRALSTIAPPARPGEIQQASWEQ